MYCITVLYLKHTENDDFGIKQDVAPKYKKG